MQKILLVEDEEQIATHLMRFLAGEGFLVEAAYSQKEALLKLENGVYDLVLLDVSLPDGSGYAVCAAVQKERQIPVIFLTASGDEYSVVAGLDMGADDYIAKPFRPRELVSRIRSVLRRRGRERKTCTCGALSVNPDTAVVTKAGKELFLSALEYRLLLVFMQNQGMVLTRDRLLEEIWNVSGEYVNDNTLTVYMKRLREKIEDDAQSPKLLHTVRGLGYRMEEQE